MKEGKTATNKRLKAKFYRQHEKDESCHPQHQDLLVAFALGMQLLVIGPD